MLGAVILLACTVAFTAVLLRHEPAFYRARLAGGPAAIAEPGVVPVDPTLPAPAVEQNSRRLVTKISALHASVVQPGSWEAAITEDELNAWLDADLPRNHSRLLPRWLSEPRVELLAKQVRCGVRVGTGGLSSVAWIDAEVVLRDVNQLGIVLEDARLGGLPLPRGPIIRELARRIDGLGMVTDLRRLDGRTVLVVYIPSTHDAGALSYWLQSLALTKGEALISGITRRAGLPVRP